MAGFGQPFLVLSLALLFTCVLSQQQYFIAPNSSLCHTNTPCYTLDQLAQTDLANGTNLTLIFQPGEHTLSRLLSIRNFKHVEIIGQNTSVISLHEESRIELSDIDQLSIKGLTFTGYTVDDSMLPKQRLSISNTYNLSLNSCCFTGLDTLKTTDKHGDVHYGDILSLRNTGNAVIENVLLKGNNGTALNISVAGTVAIESSTFTANQGYDGGAVYIDSVYTTVTINNSIFTSNSADNNGGAIYMFIRSGVVSISHSVLTGNNAEQDGGGICVASGNASISYSTLTGNSARQDGGGINVRHSSGSATVSHSNLTDNHAEEKGGGIYVDSGSASISHSVLTGNSAWWIGGGIYVSSGSASLSGSNLTGNSAPIGGGILVESGNVSISHSNLTGNSAHLQYGGGIYVFSGSASVSYGNLIGNSAGQDGGGIYIDLGSASISHSLLTGNNANYYGGGINVESGSASISGSVLTDNHAGRDGGGINVNSGSASISCTNLAGNSAWNGGGIYVDSGSASVSYSNLVGNSAKVSGGGINVRSGSGSAFVSHSNLTSNSAYNGGGILVGRGNASLFHSIFRDNRAKSGGGGINVHSGNASISDSVLTGNSASEGGAIFAAEISQSVITGTSILQNTAGTGVLYISQSTLTFLGINTVSNNNGSIHATDSQVHFNGHTVVDNNHGESGGAIEAVQSQIYFNSAVTISNNTAATTGGGIFLRGSSLFVKSPANISHNTANEGGAIYAYQSTIEFNNAGNGNMISNNHAYNNGGGIYAIALIINVTKSFVNVELNTANENGGGLYLQQNTRLYIQRLQKDQRNPLVKLTVSNNTARLGGGIYVDDSTASGGACRSRDAEAGSTDFFRPECFIQTIKLQSCSPCIEVNTFISHNTAQSGSAIYGGLLDRCTASQTAELNGLEYIRGTVDLPEDKHSISSDPLQMKLCDRSYHSNVLTRKGQSFTVHVKAIDQAGNPVNATVHSSVVTQSGVRQYKHEVGSECTDLEYNVFSEDSSAQVELYAEGPCSNLGISKLAINITFLECTCPLGFHPPSQSNFDCSCECDEELHTTECFPEEGTFQLDTTRGLWVGRANCNGTGYLVHDCPFDYCVDKPVNISLKSSEEIDVQCAYNRSGVLCGKCDEGLSLVLANSKCEECSNVIFLLLLIPFALAGIVLVVFILWLNITIATGTNLGLIFYANVLAANKAIFLPFPSPNFLTVFVSWVNLDLGIETCFYDGMNSQAKVLLQLVFPAYLFLLIFLIIILSKYVNSFAKLLSNRNPVAALCTLLILSYSKLLRLIIAALQFTSLACPDGSYKILWLYDANVQYFSPNHIPQFVAAAVILTACVLFTTLLFFGQWFPRCSKWKVMKWTKNTKYIAFIDAFHAPFAPNHRYWVGLLLFALIVHNLAASMAPDTSVPVLSAGCVAVGLIVYKSVMNRVYRNRLNDALENLFLLNIVILVLGTFTAMILNNNEGQLALAYVSMSTAFILFVVITCYHFYKFVLMKTIGNDWKKKHTLLLKSAKINLKLHKPRKNADIEFPPIIRSVTRPDQLREPDLDMLAPITEEDYRQAAPIPQAENRPTPVCTSTVVEIESNEQ